MTNESDLPQFSGGLQPIGQVHGIPIASKKQSGMLMKRIMANLKTKSKVSAKGKGHKSHVGKPGRRGIEADSKVHVKSNVKFW